jgi:hypothetical protein
MGNHCGVNTNISMDTDVQVQTLSDVDKEKIKQERIILQQLITKQEQEESKRKADEKQAQIIKDRPRNLHRANLFARQMIILAHNQLKQKDYVVFIEQSQLHPDHGHMQSDVLYHVVLRLDTKFVQFNISSFQSVIQDDPVVFQHWIDIIKKSGLCAYRNHEKRYFVFCLDEQDYQRFEDARRMGPIKMT